MAQLIVLLEPVGRWTPRDEGNFDEAAVCFEQARRAAPERIAAVVVAYAAAHDDYIDFLDESGYDLDAVFNTPEGKRLAIDTSHSFTVTIVDYATDNCGLEFGGGS